MTRTTFAGRAEIKVCLGPNRDQELGVYEQLPWVIGCLAENVQGWTLTHFTFEARRICPIGSSCDGNFLSDFRRGGCYKGESA